MDCLISQSLAWMKRTVIRSSLIVAEGGRSENYTLAVHRVQSIHDKILDNSNRVNVTFGYSTSIIERNINLAVICTSLDIICHRGVSHWCWDNGQNMYSFLINSASTWKFLRWKLLLSVLEKFIRQKSNFSFAKILHHISRCS